MPTCQVCDKNLAVGVACVPGVPYSAAYCLDCLKADAHPLFIVIANTACCGGLEYCHDGWREVVDHTLAHLGKTKEWFVEEVAKSMKEEIE
jgi:hypothetical protein